MSTRLKPIENPANPLLKIAYWLSKKRLGKVISSLKVIYARLPVPFALWMNKMLSLEKKLPLPEGLRLLIRIHVAQLNTCHFCIDIGKAEAIKKFKDPKKFLNVNDFETSSLFSEKERIALRFATEITAKKVTDHTFSEAGKWFSEEELAGIAWMVTSEHVYNLMNLTFNIESDGFCQIHDKAKPAIA